MSREPVRALARLAAVPRTVDARNARVAAATAISERMRREPGGFRANATRPLSELFLPKFSPRCLHACKRFLIVVPTVMSSSNLTELRQEVVASTQFKHLAATARAASMCWLIKLMLFSNFTLTCLVTFRTIERLLKCRAHVAITVADSLPAIAPLVARRGIPAREMNWEMHVLATCKTLGNRLASFGIDLTARRTCYNSSHFTQQSSRSPRNCHSSVSPREARYGQA